MHLTERKVIAAEIIPPVKPILPYKASKNIMNL